ncbi:MAG: AbrB family transcriptional regulator [Variibacter sp.]
MPRSSFLPTAYGGVAETLIVACAGGLALGLPGFPAGWLSGSIIAVSIAALAGRPMHVPDTLARISFVLTGISLGGAVTPDTVAGMAAWPASLAALTVAMIGLTAAVAFYLHKVHGWDWASATFGSFPGALATVLVLAAENRADVRAVAVVQTVRIVLLAVFLPAIFVALGLASSGVPVRGEPGFFPAPGQVAILTAVSTAVAFGMQWLRVPGGLIFGAMLMSAVLHGGGLVTAGLPRWVAIIAFMILGALTGSRFANTDVRLLRHLAGAAIGAFAVGTLFAFGFALAVAALLSLHPGDLIIAYAPGALDAMMLLALALHLNAAFVAAHHLARFILVLVAIPLVVPLVRDKGAPPDPQ